jgi:biotin operon repressor
MLDNGECESRADLARKLGISRARVTQMLQLLELDKTTLEELANLGDPLSSAIRITERKLRRIKNQSGK